MADALRDIQNAIFLLKNNEITIGEYEEIIKKWSDAESIRHGHWIEDTIQNPEDLANDNIAYKCSCCGHGDLHSKSVEVRYCWYCGAKMDLEGNKNE